MTFIIHTNIILSSSGLQPRELPAPDGFAQSNQGLGIAQSAGRADQDEWTDCTPCPADYLSVG